MKTKVYCSFKLNNEYINNVYQESYFSNEVAIDVATRLFINKFQKMDDVVDFIVKHQLLNLAYFYRSIKDFKNGSFFCENEQKEFVEQVENYQNIYDKKNKTIGYKQNKLHNELFNSDIDKVFFFDLDHLTLINIINREVLYLHPGN